MEDIARLALVEQSLRDVDSYSKVLYELLNAIYEILENPHDYELRTLKSEVLLNVLHSEAFTDYLKYIGFQQDGNNYTYPKEEALGKLRVAQAAIERKIYFCCGSLHRTQRRVRSSQLLQPKKVKFAPANILDTNNSFLLKIENLFNNMIQYESSELQELAREQIPLVKLQLMALDRVREQQRKIKTGEIKEHDLSFELALLMELLGWFKHRFFSWVDAPACCACAAQTVCTRTEVMTNDTETCRVEIYKCKSCEAETKLPRYNDPRTLLRTRKGRCGEWANCFTLLCRALGYDTRYVFDTTDHVWCEAETKLPRYNDPRTLLRTRKGRCGEWANCFTLLCRALGYDTRYVFDTTDHVWCEIFDDESNQWLHVDPCEGQLDAPLMYCHGWGKKLSYVIAFSRDDLQDVTWRYTMDHKEVLQRRNLVDEATLVQSILTLRQHRQRQVSAARRLYLARRALLELVQLMVERKPGEYESRGRISGAREWREQRGEAGKHTFRLAQKGTYDILYYTALDKYEVVLDGKEMQTIATWEAGVYESHEVFRKVENDWQMAYLAREEGQSEGEITWRLAAEQGLTCTELTLQMGFAEYEGGRVECSVQFDDSPPEPAKLGDTCTYSRHFTSCRVRVRLRGGGADWQNAQLARQPMAARQHTLRLRATAI